MLDEKCVSTTVHKYSLSSIVHWHKPFQECHKQRIKKTRNQKCAKIHLRNLLQKHQKKMRLDSTTCEVNLRQFELSKNF